MGAKIAQMVEAILRRGNDADVRRRGDDIIVTEVKKTILFCDEEFCQILLQIYAVAGRKGVCAHAGPVSLPQVWGTGN